MKTIDLKEESEPLNDEVFCELMGVTKKGAKTQALPVGRTPVEQLFLKKGKPCNDVLEQAKELGLYIPDKRQRGLRRSDFKNAKSIIDANGMIYNNFSLTEWKLLHVLQGFLSQQTQGLKRLIEDSTASEKKIQKKVDAVNNEIDHIFQRNPNAQLLRINAYPSTCPDINGFNIDELSPEAQLIIKKIKRNNAEGLVLASSASICRALGKKHDDVGGHNREMIDETLYELRKSTYLRFLPMGNIEVMIESLLDYTTYIGKNGERLYIISLSSVFGEKGASKYMMRPENDSEIISIINSEPFGRLYDWLLLELSENRRNAKGKKVNRITGITKRGEYMTIFQPLYDTKNITLTGNETEENKQGLFSIIYDPETIIHKTKEDKRDRLALMLYKLKEKGLLKDYRFTKNLENVIIEIYRLKNRNNEGIINIENQ